MAFQHESTPDYLPEDVKKESAPVVEKQEVRLPEISIPEPVYTRTHKNPDGRSSVYFITEKSYKATKEFLEEAPYMKENISVKEHGGLHFAATEVVDSLINQFGGDLEKTWQALSSMQKRELERTSKGENIYKKGESERVLAMARGQVLYRAHLNSAWASMVKPHQEKIDQLLAEAESEDNIITRTSLKLHQQVLAQNKALLEKHGDAINTDSNLRKRYGLEPRWSKPEVGPQLPEYLRRNSRPLETGDQEAEDNSRKLAAFIRLQKPLPVSKHRALKDYDKYVAPVLGAVKILPPEVETPEEDEEKNKKKGAIAPWGRLGKIKLPKAVIPILISTTLTTCMTQSSAEAPAKAIVEGDRDSEYSSSLGQLESSHEFNTIKPGTHQSSPEAFNDGSILNSGAVSQERVAERQAYENAPFNYEGPLGFASDTKFATDVYNQTGIVLEGYSFLHEPTALNPELRERIDADPSLREMINSGRVVFVERSAVDPEYNAVLESLGVTAKNQGITLEALIDKHPVLQEMLDDYADSLKITTATIRYNHAGNIPTEDLAEVKVLILSTGDLRDRAELQETGSPSVVTTNTVLEKFGYTFSQDQGQFLNAAGEPVRSGNFKVDFDLIPEPQRQGPKLD